MRLIANTITRPADTTAYAAGDLVANSTTAGSVTPFTFDLSAGRGLALSSIQRVRMFKSAASATLAQFILHLFAGGADGSLAGVPPTVSGGDNAALALSSTVANYLGQIAFDMTTGALAGATGLAKPIGLSPAIIVGSQQVYGLLAATAAYVPASGETFTVTLEMADRLT